MRFETDILSFLSQSRHPTTFVHFRRFRLNIWQQRKRNVATPDVASMKTRPSRGVALRFKLVALPLWDPGKNAF